MNLFIGKIVSSILQINKNPLNKISSGNAVLKAAYITIAGIASTPRLANSILFFTSVIAWLMGYINEKISNGSIIPSWIIHTISNLFSGMRRKIISKEW